MADILAPGDLARLIAGPGYPTDRAMTVLSVDGRTLVAKDTYHDTLAPEVYTLRKNGKWAAKGGGQWSNYLRPLS